MIRSILFGVLASTMIDNMKKRLVVVFVFTVSFLIFSSWIYFKYYFELFESECNELVESEIISVNKAYTAKEVVAGCGATIDYITRFVIVNNATKNHEVVLNLKGDVSSQCEYKWSDEEMLTINCNGDVEHLYNQKKTFESVTVNFYYNGILSEVNTI